MREAAARTLVETDCGRVDAMGESGPARTVLRAIKADSEGLRPALAVG
jgi:hypothetical protein